MTPPRPGRRREWIWHRALHDVGQCRLCGRTKVGLQYPQPWEICRHCDTGPAGPPTNQTKTP